MLDQLPVVALDVILSKLDFYSKLAVYSTSKELRMNVLVDDIWEGELITQYGENWRKLSNFLIAVNNTEFEDVREEVMSSFPKKLAKKLPDEAARLNLLRFGFSKMSGFRKYESDIIEYAEQISRIYDSWDRVLSTNENWPTPRSIKAALSLNAGATEEELDEFEKTLKEHIGKPSFELPQSFRLLYRFFNGQSWAVDGRIAASPLFGEVEVYETQILPFMFSLEAILIWIESQIGRSEEDLVGQGFIPIAASPLKYNGRALIFYFDPSSEKIFTPRRNVRADEYTGGYIIAESPLDLLKYAADVVTDTAGRIDRHEVLSEISGYREPVSLDQDDFNVTVRTAMIFHESSTNPDQYYHAYEITQSMRSDAPHSSSMRLQRRYWKIDDLAGNVDEVDGPGVIGQHPVLTPGKNHTYASRTSFATPEGLMSGFFTYCKLTEDDGPSYKMLKVPPFKLKSPVVDPELGNTTQIV